MTPGIHISLLMVGTKIPPLKNQIFIFSVINGTAVAWSTKSDKALQSHNSYSSKDPAEYYWSSFAVHRDSPLKVTLARE